MEKLQHDVFVDEQKAIEQYNETAERESAKISKLGSAALGGFNLLPEAVSKNEHIRERMEGRVIGQPAAIEAIVDALDRRDARLPTDKRPIANFAFLGPTGVGKTETAKALSEALADEGDEPSLILINGAEYSANHDVARLLGASPGYIGYGDETVLNSQNVKKNTVVLIDEAEKAAPDLHKLLLGIMEEGELATGKREVISFRDTVLIITSNLGASQMTDRLKSNHVGFAFDNTDNRQQDVNRVEGSANAAFEKYFKPEFINRLTKQVVFHPLDKDSMGEILDVKLNAVNQEFESYEKCFSVDISDEVRSLIVEEGHKRRELGARPLVRSFESRIMTMIGRYQGSDMIEHGSRVKIFHRDEVGMDGQNVDTPELVFTYQHDPILEHENYLKRQKREEREVSMALAKMEEKSNQGPRMI